MVSQGGRSSSLTGLLSKLCVFQFLVLSHVSVVSQRLFSANRLRLEAERETAAAA